MSIVAAIRTLITRVTPGKIQRVDVSGRAGETFTDRELFQDYGFASRPLPGSEGVMLFLSRDVNNAVVIATEDRRYRLVLEEGAVALYTDEGDFVHLKRGNHVHVKGGQKVTVESAVEVEVLAGTKVTLKAPLIDMYGLLTGHDYAGGEAGNYDLHGNVTIHGTLTVNGTIQANGNISASGSVTDGTGNTNHHSH